MGKVFLMICGLVGILIVRQALPDIRRYIRIRTM